MDSILLSVRLSWNKFIPNVRWHPPNNDNCLMCLCMYFIDGKICRHSRLDRTVWTPRFRYTYECTCYATTSWQNVCTLSWCSYIWYVYLWCSYICGLDEIREELISTKYVNFPFVYQYSQSMLVRNGDFSFIHKLMRWNESRSKFMNYTL